MVRVLVYVAPFGDHVIPVVLQLEDDTIIEPTDLYQLLIVNFSDPDAIAGDVNPSYVIVNDDDNGKLLSMPHSHTTYRICGIVGELNIWQFTLKIQLARFLIGKFEYCIERNTCYSLKGVHLIWRYLHDSSNC